MNADNAKHHILSPSKIALAEDFRQLLLQEFEKRSNRNSSYSLRAFAMSLDLESGYLSRVLSGKRTASKKTIQKTLNRMGVDPNRLFDESVSPNSRLKTLEMDFFSTISDWYHYAILELTRVNGFKGNIDWVSNALSLSKTKVRSAIDRLFRLKMLGEKEDGTWQDTSGNVTTVGNDFTTACFKNLQRQILEQSIEALDNIDYNERSHSSLTFAYDENNFERLKQAVRRFENELTEISDQSENSTRVYQMSVSLFPVSQSFENIKETKDENL